MKQEKLHEFCHAAEFRHIRYRKTMDKRRHIMAGTNAGTIMAFELPALLFGETPVAAKEEVIFSSSSEAEDDEENNEQE